MLGPITTDGVKVELGMEVWYVAGPISRIESSIVAHIREHGWSNASGICPHYVNDGSCPYYSTRQLAVNRKVELLQEEIEETLREENS